MRRPAVTLIEVLTVMSVLVALSAIIYVVARPAKESARQARCMSNLRQLYQAAQLYDAENPASDPLSQLLGMNARPFASGLLMSQLVRSRTLLYCPDTPECAKARIASSYSWNLLGPMEPKNESEAKRLRELCDYVSHQQGNVPVVTCYIHQEMYYDARQKVSDEFEHPFVIQLFADGHVERSRKDVLRQRVIEGLCQ